MRTRRLRTDVGAGITQHLVGRHLVAGELREQLGLSPWEPHRVEQWLTCPSGPLIPASVETYSPPSTITMPPFRVCSSSS